MRGMPGDVRGASQKGGVTNNEYRITNDEYRIWFTTEDAEFHGVETCVFEGGVRLDFGRCFVCRAWCVAETAFLTRRNTKEKNSFGHGGYGLFQGECGL